MRRFQTLLLVAGLAAAPVSAFAGPADSTSDGSVQVYEWSMGRGRLGLTLMGLTPELRSHYGAPSGSGTLVTQVEPGSPADKAGVRVGDVLIKTNEREVDDAGDVRAAMAGARKGDAITLSVLRDRKSLSIKAVLAEDAPPAPTADATSRNWIRELMKSIEAMTKPSHAAQNT